MAKLPAKTGIENPATSQRTAVIGNRQSMPVAAMAGSFSRKIKAPLKAGQDVAGEANQVKITHGKGDVGKQTWKGARNGYTTMTAPKYVGSPNPLDGPGMHKVQSVKGKDLKRTSEAKQVAGRS